MDKIKIKHTPKFIYIIMIILAVMGIGVNYYFKIAEKTEKSDMIYGLIICILFFVVLFSVIFVKTTIKFGEGSIIKCKWLFLFWKIDLNKVNAVTYTLKSNLTRGGGTNYTLHMFFYVDAENLKVLKEQLEPHIAEECIRRRFNQVELMKLYRYIENNYPDVAKGYE